VHTRVGTLEYVSSTWLLCATPFYITFTVSVHLLLRHSRHLISMFSSLGVSMEGLASSNNNLTMIDDRCQSRFCRSCTLRIAICTFPPSSNTSVPYRLKEPWTNIGVARGIPIQQSFIPSPHSDGNLQLSHKLTKYIRFGGKGQMIQPVAPDYNI
jgi:hypothetical protein